jgi:hypothetical protein
MLTEAWNKRSGIEVTCRDCLQKRKGLFYKCTECTPPNTPRGHVVCARCRKAHETFHMLAALKA